jgi:predicted nucleotidyltransferase
MAFSDIADVVQRGFGDRVVFAAVHGSAATGDVLPGLSDLDVAIVLDDLPSVADAVAMHHRMKHVSIEPCSYVQPAYFEVGAVHPLLVRGAYVVLLGEVPAGFEQQDDDLRRNGEEWLAKLPDLVRADAQAWSLANGISTARFARLLATRLKPALRALLVRAGADPQVAWSLRWDDLAAALDDPIATGVRRFLDIARLPEPIWDAIGDTALFVLEDAISASRA